LRTQKYVVIGAAFDTVLIRRRLSEFLSFRKFFVGQWIVDGAKLDRSRHHRGRNHRDQPREQERTIMARQLEQCKAGRSPEP
jgi:hypothetical protein